jgi:hypothetical protein
MKELDTSLDRDARTRRTDDAGAANE